MHISGHSSLVLGALLLVIGMVLNPSLVFEGATLGLETWWKIVFPSLLPFFVVSELLINLGIVRLLGMALEQVMRPIFGLPGAASLAIAVGYSSGYPIGGAVTARLRKEGLLTRREAEHLVSFTNNASPLFVLVAVAVGMYHQPTVGPFVLGIHYITNIIVGLLLRCFCHRNSLNHSVTPPVRQHTTKEIWLADRRPTGQILGEAIRTSMEKLLVIGGYIILFAVTIRLLARYGVLGSLAHAFGTLLIPLGVDPVLLTPLATGLFEMTLGIRLIAESHAPLIQQLVVTQFILAWSGLCIQAQVSAFAASTDIRLSLYWISRAGHAMLAGLATYILFPICLPITTTGPHVIGWVPSPAPAEILVVSSVLAFLLPCVLIAVTMTVTCVKKLLHTL